MTYYCEKDSIYTKILYWNEYTLPSAFTLISPWVSSVLVSCLPDASRTLPEFPDIDLQGKSLPEGIELEHIKSFQLLYREHCEVIS